jgi:hypothetical protein
MNETYKDHKMRITTSTWRRRWKKRRNIVA